MDAADSLVFLHKLIDDDFGVLKCFLKDAVVVKFPRIQVPTVLYLSKINKKGQRNMSHGHMEYIT